MEGDLRIFTLAEILADLPPPPERGTIDVSSPGLVLFPPCPPCVPETNAETHSVTGTGTEGGEGSPDAAAADEEPQGERERETPKEAGTVVPPQGPSEKSECWRPETHGEACRFAAVLQRELRALWVFYTDAWSASPALGAQLEPTLGCLDCYLRHAAVSLSPLASSSAPASPSLADMAELVSYYREAMGSIHMSLLGTCRSVVWRQALAHCSCGSLPLPPPPASSTMAVNLAPLCMFRPAPSPALSLSIPLFLDDEDLGGESDFLQDAAESTLVHSSLVHDDPSSTLSAVEGGGAVPLGNPLDRSACVPPPACIHAPRLEIDMAEEDATLAAIALYEARLVLPEGTGQGLIRGEGGETDDRERGAVIENGRYLHVPASQYGTHYDDLAMYPTAEVSRGGRWLYRGGNM
ncbi:hypothetical protein KIPB_007148 [Kipferlia bialata]|uniref:Uncharacterized protein n=1 Tax=Kipferlia bialata TaxID=797122 RepID=A0A9K3D0E4_9EUKA|nr:hypothetical protein KIPB_007148 [Kipferlia bialata]|eukprot:g7148.t1